MKKCPVCESTSTTEIIEFNKEIQRSEEIFACKKCGYIHKKII